MLIEVTEASQAGDARRKAAAFAEELQMSEEQRGEIALVTTEMATNLVKHAGRGHILLQNLHHNGHIGMRVMVVDKGPGIGDIGKALSDGPLGSGSLGSGLGTIRRVPDSFDLYSAPGAGTIISVEFWRQATSSPGRHPVALGVVSEPIRGEDVCGDGWALRPYSDGAVFLVVDGLGHGILAADAAREAERVFAISKEPSLTGVLNDIHDALKKTRGAAAALARIDSRKGLVTFAGVGNIAASLVSQGASRSMASYNGTVGLKIERLQEFTYPWSPGNLLVMHSDGLMSRWDLERYPGVWNKPPSVIAALLHRDFDRGRDDVTVLVAKAV
jgi:anti-sigma regulatory factor (Ser/Thr protein kinase)